MYVGRRSSHALSGVVECHIYCHRNPCSRSTVSRSERPWPLTYDFIHVLPCQGVLEENGIELNKTSGRSRFRHTQAYNKFSHFLHNVCRGSLICRVLFKMNTPFPGDTALAPAFQIKTLEQENPRSRFCVYKVQCP